MRLLLWTILEDIFDHSAPKLPSFLAEYFSVCLLARRRRPTGRTGRVSSLPLALTAAVCPLPPR